jgi:hypothetical protein
MSKAVLILFAACVGLSLLSLHLVKQMRTGQARIDELQAQVARLEQQQQQTPPSAPAPDPAPAIQPEPVAAPPAKQLMATVVSVPRAAAPDEATRTNNPSREERMNFLREARERQHQLMQDPDYREALRVQQRSNMARIYPGVAQDLGLTAEQTEQLFDLLAEQQLRNSDQVDSMWDTEGLDPADLQQRQQKMQQRWTEMQQKNDAELAAQIGPDKLQAWKEYQSTLGARHQAEQLRATLVNRGVSLSDDANHAVVKAYAEAQKAEMQDYANMARANVDSTPKAGLTSRVYAMESSADMFEKQVEHTKKRNQRVLEALSPYLTYEQRDALQKEQEAELKMQEAQMRIMRAQSKVSGNGNNDWVTNSAQAIIVPAQ